MKSKQSEAKEKQGYAPKAVPMTCGNCAHYRSESVERRPTWTGRIRTEEKNIRCGIGGFAVKKMGTCDEWACKQE